MIGIGISHGHEVMDLLRQLQPVRYAVVRAKVMFRLPHRHRIGTT